MADGLAVLGPMEQAIEEMLVSASKPKTGTAS